MNPPDAQPNTSDVFTPTQKESRWLIAIVFVGIFLRLLVLVFRNTDLHTDPDAYIVHAETLRETGGYHVPNSNLPTAYRPPLYPLLLAGLRLTGLKMSIAVGTINVVAGGVLMIATWWMSRLTGLRGRLPAVAAVAVGLDPMLLRYTALPMTEVLSAGLLSIAVLQLLKARMFAGLTETADGECGNATTSAVVAGICFGLCGLCRPVALITCALLTVAQVITFFWRVLKRKYSADTRDFVKSGRVVVLPALVAGLMLLPWVVRNAIQFNAFIPATTHGGYTLLLGNNQVFYDEVVSASGQAVWQGESLSRWQESLNRDMVNDGVDETSQVAVDRWMYHRAVTTIANRPRTFLSASVLRWRRFWALRPSVDVEGSNSGWLSYGVGAWYFVLWAGLVSSVTAFSYRARGGEIATLPANNAIKPAPDIHLLWLAVLSFLLLHSFYWTNARMRAPLIGILCVLAVAGWQHLFEICNRRNRG